MPSFIGTTRRSPVRVANAAGYATGFGISPSPITVTSTSGCVGTGETRIFSSVSVSGTTSVAQIARPARDSSVTTIPFLPASGDQRRFVRRSVTASAPSLPDTSTRRASVSTTPAASGAFAMRLPRRSTFASRNRTPVRPLPTRRGSIHAAPCGTINAESAGCPGFSHFMP